jgi:antitoxin VapB
MTTALTTLFRSNTSQAVRLPKALEFPESVKKVSVTAIGNTRIIAPVGESWDVWFDDAGATADFMAERDQPVDQQREAF